jgi:hypothetical protein
MLNHRDPNHTGTEEKEEEDAEVRIQNKIHVWGNGSTHSQGSGFMSIKLTFAEPCILT